jgi:tripartite-type tricarboxylate transporter receptor subunit TctC
MKLPRRRFLHLAAGAAALPALPRVASALDYPTRPVHLIVGFPAGFSPDIIGRLTAQSLSERLGQQVIVDNRPGAASNIATELVARALPDGYTLLSLQERMPSVRRFTTISISISSATSNRLRALSVRHSS